jgi:uncharacterized protein (TIGR03067 family)
MKTKICFLLVTVLLLGAGGGDDARKKELAKLAGAWTLDELTYDGDKLKLKFKVVFKGNEGAVEGNESVQNEYAKIKFKLDPAAKPKTMEITVSAGSQTDATMEAIYELKGDELRICAKVFGKGRPRDFAAPDGSSTVLVVLKRATR